MYTAASQYGATPQIPNLVATPLEGAMADDLSSGSLKTLINPKNPLFVFGVILAVTLGAVGVAGSARVGPVRASGSVGKAS
jgi:hypothetical protein